MTFERVWKFSKTIRGSYGENAARCLYETALKVSPKHIIVEVGSYKGRSLSVLAQTKRTVISIDPLNPKVVRDGINAVKSLTGMTKRFPNVIWLRIPSSRYKHDNRPRIGMIHIDANHKYPHPLNDYLYLERWMTSNAFVAFHDFHPKNFPGVVRSIDELVQKGKLKKFRIVSAVCVTQRV